MTLGSESATATAPIDDSGCLSVSGTQLPPPSVDFQSPPATPPRKYVFGSPGMPVTASERPPRYGPTRRHFMPPKSDSGTFCATAAAARAREVRARMIVRLIDTVVLLR